MIRTLGLLAVCLLAASAIAEEKPPLVEKFLHAGKFAQGETASILALEADPSNDEIRFGLGAVQFVRAVDNLGKALYEYGAVSERATQPFLRLPVPNNESPSTISYQALGRVLDAFANDLQKCEATLADIKDADVKLRLRLAKISFDFAGTGEKKITLIELLAELTDGPLPFAKTNPEFRVHFDRGDVAWLRAYCHLLSAMVEGYRAVDEEAGFENRVKFVFPLIEKSAKTDDDWLDGLRVVDPPRLRRMRLHLLAVCDLNRETWRHIRAEVDDDFEWLPHPKQNDQLNQPLSDARINNWLNIIATWEGLLNGKRLVPWHLCRFVDDDHEKGMGLSVRKLLDDPPLDLLNQKRLQEKGIDAKYLEPQEGRPTIELNDLTDISRFFEGPLGFAYGARLN